MSVKCGKKKKNCVYEWFWENIHVPLISVLNIKPESETSQLSIKALN